MWSVFPEWIVVGWCVLFGLIVGSFLNVVIYRFHTGKSLEGRSHCLSCGHTLSWLCLFPVLSYLTLRGRCAYCHSRISPRYLFVELLTGALFGMVAALVDGALLRVIYLVFVSILVLVIVYDLLHTIIPDELVALLFMCAVAISGVQYWIAGDEYAIALRALAGAVGFLFFASLWLVSEGRWIGLGDAKLAAPLGIILSWPEVMSALILSFWVGAAVSITLLFVQRTLKRGQHRLRFLPSSLTIKSEVPFAPFLIAGFFLTHFAHVNVFQLIASILPL